MPFYCVSRLFQRSSVSNALPIQYVIACLLCMTLLAQNVHAANSRLCIATTSLITMIFGLTYYSGSIKDWSYTPDFGKGKNRLPSISYTLDKNSVDGSKNDTFTLTPVIHRGRYLAPLNQDKNYNQFVHRAVCDPVLNLPASTLTLNAIKHQCDQWFDKHEMRLPHEVAGIPADQLDTLLLPRLLYSVNEDKLEIQPVHVTYIDETGHVSHVENEATHQDTVLWKNLVPDIATYHREVTLKGANHTVHMCHHMPKRPSMQEPKHDLSGNSYLSFPIPGISHLHMNSGPEYFIVSTQPKRSAVVGYVWALGTPWHSGLQTIKLSQAMMLNQKKGML